MSESVIVKTGSTKKESYQQFLTNVALYSIGLDSIGANLDRESYWNAHSKDVPSIANKVSSKYSLVDFDDEHFDIAAAFNFQMSEDSSNPFLNIEIKYFAHFHPKSGKFDKRFSEKFAQAEARLIFWPYFRQTMSDITARMYIPPITLPLSV